MLVRKFVESMLSDQDRRQIITDFDSFESQGSIGDSLLRTKASELANSVGDNSGVSIVTWMNFIAHECWRYYAKQVVG